MKKLRLPLLATVAAILLGPLAVEATTLKLATIVPEGTEWMKRTRAVAEAIESRTEGRVQVKIYGGGVMGNDKSVLRKIRVRQLHGGAFTGGALAEVEPSLRVYSVPFLFGDRNDVSRVRQELDSKISRRLENSGFVSFGLAGGGFARIFSNRPIRNLEDLKGQKVWVPEGDVVGLETMKALGLSPVTLPLTDVLTGLQTGLVEIVAATPSGAIALQWHTRVRYMSETPLAYIFALLALDKNTFEKLAAVDQAVVREEFEKVYRGFDQASWSDDQAALEGLRKQGVEFVSPDAADVASWRETGRNVARRLARDGIFPQDLYETALKMVEGAP